jgi:uncharacterized protein YegP (UPF0339 family)
MSSKWESINWEFYQDNAGEYRWRAFHSQNGVQIGRSSEGFASEDSAMRNAGLLGYEGGAGDLKWELYQDASEEWRWRADSAANGQNVGASSEGYSSMDACVNNAEYFGYSAE